MPNSFFSSVDRNGVDIKLWRSETFFSQLGRYLESSRRKFSTANKAYTYNFLTVDSKDLPSRLKVLTSKFGIDTIPVY